MSNRAQRSHQTRVNPKINWILAIIAGASLVGPMGCGDDGESDGGGETSGTTTGSTTDGTTDGTASNTAGGTTADTTPVETVFPIAYTARNRSNAGVPEGGALMMLMSDGSMDVQVSPEEVECHKGCDISDDLQWFVWSDPDVDGVMNIAPITDISFAGVTVDLASKTTTPDIINWKVGGSNVSWKTTDFEVYGGELPGTNAELLKKVGEVTGTQGGYVMTSDGNSVYTWTLDSLVSMTLNRHEIGGETTNDLYTFNYTSTGGTGSFFGTQELMAESPDGRYLAVMTGGLSDTTPCSNNTECLSTEFCGTTGRCSSQRLVLNMIAFDDIDKLLGSCTSSSECGASHFCDFADPADANSGKCLPGRLDLGPTEQEACTRHQPGEFTEARDKLVWSSDSEQVFMLLAEDCSRYNIPRAGILKTTPLLESAEVVLVNEGLDFDPGNCYDSDEMEYVVDSDECVLDIVEFSLASTGATIVFAASSPKADNNFELYTVDINGTRGKKWLTDTLETIVIGLRPLQNF